MSTFAEIGLQQQLLDAVQDLGFETPTPIQIQTIPHLLSSEQDLMAFAQTGTGKTAAFGLPVLQLVEDDNPNPQALILCPTRELCLQITRDLEQFAKYRKNLNVVPVYGGASIGQQIKAIKRGAQVVVGTPGRMRDLIERGKLDLSGVSRLVLDEADEMLTMGFKEELDAILSTVPKERQTLLFSATMSKEVQRISSQYMQDPEQISVARRNAGAEQVEHHYYMVRAQDKYEVLKRLADINPNIYGIVFCRTRRDTKEIANKLGHDGYNADAIHGDLSQPQRDEVMDRFRSGQLQLLVATDVAARGLDVEALTHVINFNLPDDPEIYVHRSGRTGRAGKSGLSIAIIHTREQRKLQNIGRATKIEFHKKEVPSGEDICRTQLYRLIDDIKDVKVGPQIEPFLPAIYEKLEGLSREELIQHFVSAEFNRFLDYYKGARDINISERDNRGNNKPSEKKTRSERRKTPFASLFLNVGNKQNLTPARLIGIINNALDSSDATIGKIDIGKKGTFFELDVEAAPKLKEALKGHSFNGVSLQVEASPVPPDTGFGKKQLKKKFGKKKKRNYRK
jgi:ATP-dependent RNA helicase DeaD